MPEYLAPGVYVEEVDSGPKPIEGVSTSTSGMVGVAEWGPVNVPTLVTSLPDFKRKFGGYLNRRIFQDTWYLPHAVKGFFDNGGKRLYVVRVLPNDATYSQVQLYDRGDTGVNFETQLASRAEQDEAFILVEDDTDIGVGNFLLISDGSSSEYRQVADGDFLALLTPVVSNQTAETNVVGYTLVDDGVARQLSSEAVTGGNTIVLDDVTGLLADGGDLLRIVDGERTELVETSFADPTDPAVAVGLQTPLAYQHPTTTEVQLVTITNIGNTTLLHLISAGDRLILVEDASQLTGVDAIGFGGPPSTEFHVLGNVGVVTTTTPLALNHPSGTEVVIADITVDGTARDLTEEAQAGDTLLELANRSGLVSGSILRLRLSPDNEDEFVIIDEVVEPSGGALDPGVVTLVNPLQRDYESGQEVRSITDNDNDTNPTLLARDANPSERVLVLTDVSGYVPDLVIRVEALTSERVEYFQLLEADTALVPLEQPLGVAHRAGLEVLGRAQILLVQAIDQGAWGNCLRITVNDDTPILETRVPSGESASAGDPTLTLVSVVGIEPGTVLEFYQDGAPEPEFLQKVESVLSGNRVGFGPGGLEDNVTEGTRVRTREFRLTTECVQLNPRTLREQVVPEMTETLRQLSMDPRHSRYVVRVVGPIPEPGIPLRADGRTEGESDFIRVQDPLVIAPFTSAQDDSQAQATLRLGPDLLRETLANGSQQLVGRRLTGGDDAVAQIVDTTYIGNDAVDPQARTGLFALKNIEEISIVAIPGRTNQQVQEALITHCELLRYRFSVLDSQVGDGIAEVQEQRGLYDSRYAALYYPWLRIIDPFPENPRVPGEVSIPPSGHLMGIYARNDIERGVHKAPANETIRGISNLEFKLVKEEQDILNPNNINVLRNFRDNNRGLRVWGARTVSSDSDWRYVNVRRLFIFVENSIDRGTQWAVFEPNDETTWARLRRTVSAFLTNVWRSGALQGRTPEEAFFVKIGLGETMTQDDIDNGRLIMLIGIAPVKPAEFVIFRIGQFVGGSEVEEL